MVEVDVWADVRCPWCWIGLRRVSRAVVASGEPVQIRRRSFLLEPEGPATPGLTTAQAAVTEWGLSPAQWESKSQHIRAEGRRIDLDVNVDGALMFDSRPVHRLLKLAAAADNVDTDAAWDAAFAAHFNRNEDLGNTDVLRDLAADWGLTDEDIVRALTLESFAIEVDRDLAEARGMPVDSVPTVVSADGHRVSGTSSVEDLTEFLSRAGATR